MTFGVSPGVSSTEIDLTTVIPAASASVGAFVGCFRWGPVEQQVLNTSSNDLDTNYIGPDLYTQVDYLTAASYLSYSNALRIVRAYDSTNALNATTVNSATPGPGTGLLVKNAAAYSSLVIPTTVEWIAKYPGAYGNALKTVMISAPTANVPAGQYPPSIVALQNALAAATSKADIAMYGGILNIIGRTFPTTSLFASSMGATNDEIHFFVVDYTGVFTGTPGTILESYLGISLGSNALSNDGTSNYYVNVLNNKSKYIWFGSAPSVLGSNAGLAITPGINFASTSTLSTFQLNTFAGGSDGNYPLTSAQYVAAYNFFQDKSQGQISFIIMGAQTSVATLNAIQNIAEVRKDCVVYCSPAAADVIGSANPTANCLTYRDPTLDPSGATRTDTLGGYNTSYAFIDCNWKYMYNKYNNSYVWVPLNGDTAGVAAATDLARAQWYSPAGYNRGIIKNAIKLAWNPNEAQRDLLYTAAINPVVSFPGKGIILYGDKTLTSKPSAFSRINVRRLFIVLEVAIKEAAKYSLFEFNDQFTRAQFVSIISPFLRQVQGQRGITDFYVQCDTSNNTGIIIDNNQFVASIYIKPARSINYIQLNFVAVGTSVDFTTVVGSF